MVLRSCLNITFICTLPVLLIYYIGIRLHILIYIKQDETLHCLFYMKTSLHVSGGTTTHHQEGKQLYLQHLVFFTLLLLPAAIVEELELI
jgi:hypothetical protein